VDRKRPTVAGRDHRETFAREFRMLASLVQRGWAVFSTGAVSLQTLMAGATIAVGSTGQEPVACDLVDATSAERVLGSGATNVGGADVASVCRYDSADHDLVLIVQVLGVVMYDATPINPQTPVDIGDRGRYGVGASGSANVQFAKGEFSVTLRVTPMSGPPASALVEPMLEIARRAADRMPG
jgi:hypothetical protein